MLHQQYYREVNNVYSSVVNINIFPFCIDKQSNIQNFLYTLRIYININAYKKLLKIIYKLNEVIKT